MNDGHDDRSGAGAPNGARAKEIMDGRSYYYDRRFEPSDLGAKATMTVKPRERVRVVMTWDQCPYDFLDPPLNVDFDLVVRKDVSVRPPFLVQPRPEAHFNLSSADNYEIVEFVSDFGGNYKAEVSAPRWSTCSDEGGTRRAHLVKGANSRVAIVVGWLGGSATVAFSFLYLALRALLGAPVRSRRGLDVKDVEQPVLRQELEVLRRRVARPQLRAADRALLAAAACHLPRSWDGARLVTRGRCCAGIARWCAGSGDSHPAGAGARASRLRCARSCSGWLARIRAGAIGGSRVS
jgi:hypothetical protein